MVVSLGRIQAKVPNPVTARLVQPPQTFENDVMDPESRGRRDYARLLSRMRRGVYFAAFELLGLGIGERSVEEGKKHHQAHKAQRLRNL